MTLQERLRGCGHFRLSHPHFSGVSDTCDEAADRIDALERENAALRKDAERIKTQVILPQQQALYELKAIANRYRYLRKALTWYGDGNGEVRWTILIPMPEPDISAAGLTSDSVAQALDAAIDAAMAQR